MIANKIAALRAAADPLLPAHKQAQTKQSETPHLQPARRSTLDEDPLSPLLVDLEKAIERMERFVAWGHADGQCASEALPQEEAAAYARLARAGVANTVDACHTLARCYSKGIGVKIDLEKASHYQEKARWTILASRKRLLVSLKQAALQARGDAHASTRSVVPAMPQQAGPESSPSSGAKADPLSFSHEEVGLLKPGEQYLLGTCYLEGAGIPRDERFARFCFGLAALTQPEAQYRLGKMYRQGVGGQCDSVAARNMLELAARSGHAGALVELGLWHSEEGGKKTLAYECFLKAATLGDPSGQRHLALCYQEGVGTLADPELAAEWMEKSALQGNAEAQWRIGQYYETGTGVEKSEASAFRWYKKSAKGEDAQGQRHLARCFNKGIGVVANADKAAKWLKSLQTNLAGSGVDESGMH